MNSQGKMNLPTFSGERPGENPIISKARGEYNLFREIMRVFTKLMEVVPLMKEPLSQAEINLLEKGVENARTRVRFLCIHKQPIPMCFRKDPVIRGCMEILKSNIHKCPGDILIYLPGSRRLRPPMEPYVGKFSK